MYFSRIVTAGLVLLSNAAFAVAQADLTQAQVDTIVASLKNITSLTRDLKLKSSEINPTTDLIGYAPQALPVPLPLPSLPVASKYKDVQDMLNSAGSIAVGFANSVPSGAINNAANVQAVKDELVALYFEIIAMICTLTDKACRFSVVPAAGENIKSAINNYSNGIGSFITVVGPKNAQFSDAVRLGNFALQFPGGRGLYERAKSAFSGVNLFCQS